MSDRRIIFETERLIVRLYDINDEETFFQLNGDEEVVRYIRPAKSREDCNVFLQQIIESYKSYPLLGRWAVDEKLTGRNIGMFAIIPIDDSDKLQLGYSLLKDSWGKGYSTELSKEGINYFFKNIDKTEVYAITELANIASQKVLEKSGFNLNNRYTKAGKDIMEYLLSRSGNS